MNSVHGTTTSTMSVEMRGHEAGKQKRGVISGVITGAIMMALGLFAAFSPLTSGILLAFLVTAGMGIYGAVQAISFFRTSREGRSGLMLVNGMLLMALSLFALYVAIQSVYGTLTMVASLSSVVAVFTVFGAITQFAAYLDRRRQQPAGGTFLLVNSIFSALLGLLLLANPVVGWFSMSIMWGLYLSILGISLMVESLAAKRFGWIGNP